MERAPRVLPAGLDVRPLDDVEADRRLVGVDRICAVELLDPFGKEMEQQEELGLAADDDISLQRQRNALFNRSRKPYRS
jgi:hypothetical protein